MTRAMFFLLMVSSIVTISAYAVPQQINYQGYLTNPGGSPLDTTVAMTFKLYTDSTAGSLLWTETRPAVTVTKGLFNVRLGQVASLGDAVFNNAQIWLGITVGNNSEMTPRSRIVSVGYSYRVGTVDGASGGTIAGDVNIVGMANIGYSNYSPAGYSAFVAGVLDTASGILATVSGGTRNKASIDLATVSGGYGNTASGQNSTVSGGCYNTASEDYSTMSGGYFNTASGGQATIGGGSSNNATANGATVGGGNSNNATGGFATVGGGHHNYATANGATVGGGSSNNATANGATVGGGNSNNATGGFATVGGGHNNYATGDSATIGGGWSNSASGRGSTVPGGCENIASGAHSFAAGYQARAIHNGAFVWADSSWYYDNPFVSSEDNQFSVRASGGTRIYSNWDLTAGVYLAPGASAWVAVSDSTKKQNIRLVDTKGVLDKVSQLPIKQWSYKSQDPSIEHIGPMAQDFWRLFHIGDDSLTISTIDPDGIALAAIQELQKQNAELKKELNDLRSLVEKMAMQHDTNGGKAASAAFVPKTHEPTLKEMAQ